MEPGGPSPPPPLPDPSLGAAAPRPPHRPERPRPRTPDGLMVRASAAKLTPEADTGPEPSGVGAHLQPGRNHPARTYTLTQSVTIRCRPTPPRAAVSLSARARTLSPSGV
ncbi:hypothetical protein GFH48_13385 [Streptomyces fagopyri]|uniref:Uncharacterized protein n=1 Tax=Streptomyces fagopyri TaxID=2662397 RepID=A0A5Q0LAP2_9ACTN|nr:hypothetical protein GFH48_13385 [Streptomyces fagopyri]